MIPEKLYRQILQVLPIICVDIIVANADGQFLLVKRNNEPLKNQWWVIGGRVEHMETAEAAAIRKLKEEVGIDVSGLKFDGYYEDTFDCNSFESDSSYHTISLVFSVKLEAQPELMLDNQSSACEWKDELPERLVVRSSVKNNCI